MLKGRSIQFVDDGFVVTLKEDIEAVKTFLTGLLGPDALQLTKLKRGSDSEDALDFIGYNVSLLTQHVTIATHNLRRAIFAFGEVHLTPDCKLEVRTLQRLASLGSRYGGICRLMKPFVRVLYQSYKGRAQNAMVKLDSLTKSVIRLFRVLFVMAGIRPTQFSQPFRAFQTRIPTMVAEFDASLEGISIIWLRIEQNGSETPLAYTSVDIRSLNFTTEARYQNTAEYLASLLCVRGLTMLGFAGEPVLFRGDSLSALAWIKKGSVRSCTAVKTALMWAQHTIFYPVTVTGTHHLSGLLNTRTDRLSRNGTWAQVLEDDLKIHGRKILPNTLPFLNLHCEQLLELCDPSIPIESDEDFTAFFIATNTFLKTALPVLNNPLTKHPTPSANLTPPVTNILLPSCTHP